MKRKEFGRRREKDKWTECQENIKKKSRVKHEAKILKKKKKKETTENDRKEEKITSGERSKEKEKVFSLWLI